MIESQPTAPTKEKRFAYSLYLDTLMLIVKIAQNVEKRGGARPLYDNSFIRNLVSDEKVKSLMAKYDQRSFPFSHALPSLVEKVKESGVYKNYIKKPADKHSPGEEVEVWENILNLIVFPYPLFTSSCEERENYSLRGVERMKEMIEATFTNSLASYGNEREALKQLKESLFKARELYFRLLLLPVELTQLRENQIEENRTKYIRTAEDINPNMRFVENQLVALLSANEEVTQFAEENHINWNADDAVLMNSLLHNIMDSQIYKDYMEFPVTDLATDCEFWRNVFKNIIFKNELFLETLEDKSVFWNDDIEIIGTFVLKTMKRFADDMPDKAIMSMYKDEEDANFGAELFMATVRSRDKFRQLIDNVLDKTNWESERLAFMDIIICMTALAEIINFPKIALQVSVNEYIEIAKSYSLPKSGSFIHGLLSAIIKKLQEEKVINKEM